MVKAFFLVCLIFLLTACTPFIINNPEASLSAYEKALKGIKEYWSFDDGEKSETGSRNEMVPKGNSAWAPGRSGQGLRFNGASVNPSWAESTKPVFDFGSGDYEFTVAFWLYLSISDTSQITVLSDLDGSTNQTVCSIDVAFTYNMFVNRAADVANTLTTSGMVLTNNAWNFVAITLKKVSGTDHLTNYLGILPDTVLVGSGGDTPFFVAGNKTLTLGAYRDGTGISGTLMSVGEYFIIDEFMIFDRALSVNEIQALLGH